MQKKTILLVEDDLGVREALSRALSFQKYHVVHAATGAQALRECLENHIDVVLLDLNLGLETGWDTVEDLAALRPLLPIIVMSGRPEQFAHASASAASAFMEKPMDLPFLFQKLATLSALPHATSLNGVEELVKTE
jgi:DNA-binding response OmpR family regulator